MPLQEVIAKLPKLILEYQEKKQKAFSIDSSIDSAEKTRLTEDELGVLDNLTSEPSAILILLPENIKKKNAQQRRKFAIKRLGLVEEAKEQDFFTDISPDVEGYLHSYGKLEGHEHFETYDLLIELGTGELGKGRRMILKLGNNTHVGFDRIYLIDKYELGQQTKYRINIWKDRRLHFTIQDKIHEDLSSALSAIAGQTAKLNQRLDFIDRLS